MTVCFHVNDLKVSHHNDQVIEEFVQWVKSKYGKEREVTVRNKEDEHTYLGMTLRYDRDGSVSIDMVDYVKDMIKEFPVKLNGRITTPPAKEHSKEFKKSIESDVSFWRARTRGYQTPCVRKSVRFVDIYWRRWREQTAFSATC